ncbi:MAG TPA: AraC family transcriptional regulator [Variovorax sp.]|nr:AraC family transcriptional regulator [Variovorax sp.]
MRTRSAEQRYRERVARVVAFIVAHPLETHRLEDLAAMAHFSPCHFHRVYSSVTGETVAATVRRVRLHDGPLSTIPHTQRRLHQRFGVDAPSQWLGASYGDPADTVGFKYDAAADSSDHAPAVGTDIEVIDIPAGRYARHRLSGPYARISAALAALHTRWLPGRGYEPDDRPTLEHYLNSPRDALQAGLLTDLLIPIRSAATS